MNAISVRSPHGSAGDVDAWERIIYGVRYWFDATPYEVKVFRLRLDGGDLVHHWRDTPDVIGEYDRYDASTHPKPGEVAWQHRWGPNNAERQYVTSCRVCGDVVEVTREQLIVRHGDRYGTRTCEATGTTATLKAALVREAKLNHMEQRISDVVHRWWSSCWGYDTLTGEECHHPICGTRPRVRR
ncbi:MULTISPECIES: hypothetical protein [unclassified Streptomyces]|uniref:hypothetical protein n=1 Tax=unclassified Streptomyces TaxID=2593676 RepID=UPI0033CB34F8